VAPNSVVNDPNSDIALSHPMSVGAISSSLSGRNFAEFPHLLRLSIASSCSSRDRGEMPSTRNPGKLPEAVVSICISSTRLRVRGGRGKISATPASASHKANGIRITTGREPAVRATVRNNSSYE
jgi:hypothetical protein